MKSLSHVRLFATPWAVAYQAPPSMGFSGVGCHFLLQRKGIGSELPEESSFKIKLLLAKTNPY